MSSPATRHYWSSWELLVIKNGTSDSLQLIVPRKLQREVLGNAHDGLLGGHLGQKKTREKAPLSSIGGVFVKTATTG